MAKETVKLSPKLIAVLTYMYNVSMDNPKKNVSPKDINENYDKGSQWCSSALKRLIELKFIKASGRGKYQLLSAGKKYIEKINPEITKNDE